MSETPMRLSGWHGEARGTIAGAFASPELYVALEPSLAEDYADGTGRVLRVTFDAVRPLVLTDPASAADAIRASDMLSASGKFHGSSVTNSSHAFAEWARAQGYDAVVFEPACFEQADASDSAYADWDMVAGTFGDPQLIILEPARAEITAS